MTTAELQAVIDDLCEIRLSLDETIARLRAEMPLQNGSGGASLPTFDTMQEAYHYAAECTAKDGCEYDVQTTGECWVVRMRR